MNGYYNRNNRGITKKLGPVTAYADAVLAGYKGTREQWAQDMAKLGQNVTQVAQNTKLTTELAEQTRVNTAQVAQDTDDVRRLAQETSNNAEKVATDTAESTRLAEETKKAAAQAKADAEYAGAAADNFRVDTTLTEEGKAAEAKATGERLVQLSEAIVEDSANKIDAEAVEDGFSKNLNNRLLWEQGNFTSTGGKGDSTAAYYPLRIRTKDFIPVLDEIVVESPYELNLFKYDKVSGEFIEEMGNHTIYEATDLDFDNYSYKGQLRNGDAPYDTLDFNSIEAGNIVKFYAEHFNNSKIDTEAFVEGYAKSINRKRIWEQGSISDIGEDSPSNSGYFLLRNRTKIFIPYVDKITVERPYEVNVYKYEKSTGSFVEQLGNRRLFTTQDFDFDKYAYRAQIRNGEETEGAVDYKTLDIEAVVKFYAVPLRETTYKRGDVYFAGVPCGTYYTGLMGDDYESLNLSTDTKSDTVVSLFDGLLTEHSDVLSKRELGLSSNNKSICEYALTPIDGDFITDGKLPKILIVCVQHGFEKSSVYGLYCFLHDLLNSWQENPVLEYIRHNVELRFIPIANPYGFDNNSYLNANGVNLNRNYDTPGYPVYPDTVPWDDQYGGLTAFDQPETQIIRDWVLSNTDAIMLVDYHTNGSGSVTEYTNINWHDYPKTENDYLFSFRDASKAHLRKITAHFAADYNLTDLGNNPCGHITGGRGTPTAADLGVWGTMQNIPTMTFEGFNGFPGKSSYTGEVIKANSELIGNWLINLLCHISYDKL